MEISVKEVEYLSRLARVELTPEELARFVEELNKILAHVEKLKQVNLEQVPPTSHVLKLSNVFREDAVLDSLPTEKALANAPSKEGPFFKVPRIIDPTT